MEQQFGKYRLLRRIGAGGFGVVYEGYDPSIRRRVAIKTCTSVDPRVRMRFAREAEVNGNLSHPNIVVVFDYGEVDGSPFLVQEFLTGEDLDVKIDSGERMPLAQKVNYLIQIADGLSHAHRHGVVHRDIKPANVRVLDNGVVKVMDFGIAWIKNDASITLTGRTVGTAAYMAPEQLRNESVGPQADIFSFGVLAYELLTGERAFAGDSASQILYQVLNAEPPPIRSRCPDVPPELAALIAGCHRKDPEARYLELDSLIPAFRHLEKQVAGLDTAGLPIPLPAAARPQKPPLSTPTMPTAVTVLAPPDDRTIPLPQAPPASRLDSIDLRAAGRPAPRVAEAGSATAARPRGWSLVWIAAALALLALAATAIARRQALGEAWSALWAGSQETAAEPAEPATPPPLGETASAAEPTPPPGETRVEKPAPSPEPSPAEPPRTAATTASASQSSRTTESAADNTDSPSRATPPAAPPRARARVASGAISVRVALGAPQAWAWLDDRALGRTPIRRAPVAPGRHRLRVALDPNAGADGPGWEIRVAGGHELILTIDPAASTPPREVRRPLVP